MSKRSSSEIERPRSVDTKTIKSIDGARKTVAEFGSEQQIRAGATAQVSPDATRFVPPQVARKTNSANH